MNDAMKPIKMKVHLKRVHADKKNKDLDFKGSERKKLESTKFEDRHFLKHLLVLIMRED